MSLAPGVRLGAYEIIEFIGAGGMGEVYKAVDIRLNRTVALKLLPEAFAAEGGVRHARFDREARAIATLNHPHICRLYDIGIADEKPGWSSDRVQFLVMEYIDGRTVADRLIRGPLPIPEVLRCAVQLADALDHAHRRGFVHRDLKPANIMLTDAGVKILDFGLCKVESAPSVQALSTVAASDPALTGEAAVLGTFPYMSPEQLTGGDADERSDVFALGAVIYEMATGRRPFQGPTTAALIGAVLHTEPPSISRTQRLAPPALNRVVGRCLAKDPNDRWQSARDLMLELASLSDNSGSGTQPRARRTRLAAVAAAMIAAVAVGALAVTARLHRSEGTTATISLTFSPPDGVTLADLVIGGPVTVSPDGQQLAFVGIARDGRQLLWVRSLASLSAHPLPGTDGATYPFWSPDSRAIGFFSQRKLRTTAVAGGPPQTLCDAVLPRGGTWSRDGVILFSAGAGRQLSRVQANGGVAVAIPADRVNQERYWPSFLPDGRHFVYFARPQKYGIYVDAIDSPGARLLLSEYVGVQYAPPGYLLVLRGPSRGAPAGALLAQPFDPIRLQITGDPTVVAERIRYESGLARGAFWVSANGALVYEDTDTSITQLAWFDRTGKPLGTIAGSEGYGQPSLSPDGRTVAVEHVDPATQDQDIWLIETGRQIPSRLTSHPNNITFMPVWSPDGDRIVYASARDAPPNLFQQSVGVRLEELLIKSASNNQPTDWSPDGRFLLFAGLNPTTQWDLWLLPTSGAERQPHPTPFAQTEFNEHLGRFSPDGRWIAYTSDESGRNEVYVQAFPSGLKRRVSASGGNDARWRGDGREVFFLAPDGTVMSVAVNAAHTFEIGMPARLFKIRMGPTRNAGYDVSYAVTRDGQRFLVSSLADDAKALPSTTVVLNWETALGR